MILSFHPIFGADHFRLCAGREVNDIDLAWMKKAEAVILPQHRHAELFWASKKHCDHVFPEYTCRYLYPDKLGDIRLFRDYALPHPASHIFPNAASCSLEYLQGLQYPAVIKSNYGSEGSMVFFVHSPQRAAEIVHMLGRMEGSGFYGFLIQDWIENDGRTLRVVVLGDYFVSYWRNQPDDREFLHNIEAGGVIDQESDPELQARGVKLVQRLCVSTGINLAGVDLLFPRQQNKTLPRPLLLEINYYFARRGLGGNEEYYSLLKTAIQNWLWKKGVQGRLE